MERTAEMNSTAFGPRFVAAFAQSNEGDTSPNIQGAYCGQSGADHCLSALMEVLTADACQNKRGAHSQKFCDAINTFSWLSC